MDPKLSKLPVNERGNGSILTRLRTDGRIELHANGMMVTTEITERIAPKTHVHPNSRTISCRARVSDQKPMLVVVAVLTHLAVGCLRGTPPLVRRALPVIMALLLTGLTNYWAMIIETLRLRNEHLADRVTVLPTASHGLIAFAGLFVACIIVARASARRPSASRIATAQK